MRRHFSPVKRKTWGTIIRENLFMTSDTPVRTLHISRWQESHKILRKLTLACQLYKPSVWRWIDSCQNQASADKYHMAISRAQLKDRSFWGEILHFKHLARFGGNRMAALTNNNKKAESFFRLNFNIYTNVDNREKARTWNKKNNWDNFVGRKHENFVAAVRKWEMLAATKVKMNGSEKPNWTGTQTFPP